MQRSTIVKFMFALALGLAACAQEARWQTACGCVHPLDNPDFESAQEAAFQGNLEAVNALAAHYSISLSRDEAGIWRQRGEHIAEFRRAAVRYNATATRLGLATPGSLVVSRLREDAAAGDANAIARLTVYLRRVGLDWEAAIWEWRKAAIAEFETIERRYVAIADDAAEADDLFTRQVLIGHALQLQRGASELIPWSERTLQSDNRVVITSRR